MKTTINANKWVYPLKAIFIISFIACATIPGALPLAGLIAIALLYVFVQIGATPLQLTQDYMQSGAQKILFKEIADVKWFLGMLWVFDVHGESICIAPQFYAPDQISKITERIKSTG